MKKHLSTTKLIAFWFAWLFTMPGIFAVSQNGVRLALVPIAETVEGLETEVESLPKTELTSSHSRRTRDNIKPSRRIERIARFSKETSVCKKALSRSPKSASLHLAMGGLPLRV